MEQKDAELIQQVLHGKQEAFSLLVEKYQKGIHAVVWRKIGDFHIAQEITQDTFLKAYQKLDTLKNHNMFSGWLYVIAARLCTNWFQKNRITEQSLEVTDASEVDKVSYSGYMEEKHAVDADETRREIVKELLQKLPESERTVVTLHYLGEMTIKAISEFLGVSSNTIKSRLSRARNRLRKEEDIIQQYLPSFQLPANLTENIMKEISRTSSITPVTTKPVMPWVLSSVSAIFIFLLIGVGTQTLFRHQQSYDLDATSEQSVEVIEAFIVLDSIEEPSKQIQLGNSVFPGSRQGTEPSSDPTLSDTALVDSSESISTNMQWSQIDSLEGGVVNDLFMTNSSDIFAGTPTSLYKLSEDSSSWKLVNTRKASSLSFQDSLVGSSQMKAYYETLYLATDTELLVSEDSGESWKSWGMHPGGTPKGLVITDMGVYIAFLEDIYFSKNANIPWISLKNGLDVKKIRALAAVENTVFAGTNKGLYRLDSDTWVELPVGPVDKSKDKLTIHALASSKSRLYVVAGREYTYQTDTLQKVIMTDTNSWSLYLSNDLGRTWNEIFPVDKKEKKYQMSLLLPTPSKTSTPVDFTYSNIRLIVNKDNILLADSKESFYSTNAGETWTSIDLKDMSKTTNFAPPIVMMDDNTFFIGNQFGVTRTIDAGKSWQEFNIGITGATIRELYAINGQLYVSDLSELMTTTDGGKVWKQVTVDKPDISGSSSIPVLETFNDILYMKIMINMTPHIYRLTNTDKKFTQIQGIPMINDEFTTEKANISNNNLPNQMQNKNYNNIFNKLNNAAKQGLENSESPNMDNIDIETILKNIFQEALMSDLIPSLGNFAVSGETYYLEYKQKLYRWKYGADEWHYTGLEDKSESTISRLLPTTFDYSDSYFDIFNNFGNMGFKIAVLGNTVYVGKGDGQLAQSWDEGDTWNDITADLPFAFSVFYALTFAGKTIYVATDKGSAFSRDGVTWHSLINSEGIPIIIEKFAVEGMKVYGQDKNHVYQLNDKSITWEQITPEIPDSVLSFAVDENMLYIGASNRGVLGFRLDE